MLFRMALSVSSNFSCFWRGSMFKIFSEERAWRKEQKRGYTFARFLFTATPRHKRLARKKKFPRTGQRTGFAFSLNWTFDDFFNNFFLWLLSAQGQCILEKVSWYRYLLLFVEKQNKKSAFVVHLRPCYTRQFFLQLATQRGRIKNLSSCRGGVTR